MDDRVELVEQFNRSRDHLRAVAYRMLGSADEADDAVQETWLRASEAFAGAGVGNVTGWLTTIVSRICLDMLRARRRRREAPIDSAELAAADDGAGVDPAGEAALRDSVGAALLVVLDRLGPAERVAFVLHDLFAVPFDEIGVILRRSTAAAKKLASRARHRVRGPATVPDDLVRQRRVVEAFLAAARAGDLDALLAMLAPEVVRRADAAVGAPAEVRGADAVARETLTNVGRARYAEAALVDGAVGIVVAPRGRLELVLRVTVEGDRVAAVTVVGDPVRLRRTEIRVLDPTGRGRTARP